MTDKQLITFVLPVFNEELNVEELTEKINATMAPLGLDYELLFVDDGSRDGSFKLLTRMQQTDPRIRAIRFRRNFGKAAAYAAGFDHANGDIIITMDTDLQDDPAEIPLFLEQLEAGYDMVSGWKHTGKGPLTKSLPSRFFNAVVRRVTGIPLHDFNCPFKAYRKEVLEEIDVYGELHRYIPVLAFARGFNVTEIKISNLPRIHGSSNYGFERFIRGMFDLITVVFITRFAKRPMHLLAMAGVITSVVGATILSYLIGAHVLYRAGVLASSSYKIHDRPILSLGVLLIIVGIQFFSSGLLAELVVTGFSSGSSKAYSVKKQIGK